MNHDEWQPCEPGLLTGCAKQARPSLTKAIADRPLTVGLLVGAVLSAAVTGYVMTQDSDHPSSSAAVASLARATLTCEEVGEALAARREAPLESSLQQRVETHLASCDLCRTAYKQMLQRGELPEDAFRLSRRGHTWNQLLLADVATVRVR